LLLTILDAREYAWKLYSQEKARFDTVTAEFYDRAKKMDLAADEAFQAAHGMPYELMKRFKDHTLDPRARVSQISLFRVASLIFSSEPLPLFLVFLFQGWSVMRFFP